jgi:hypothetical protein
MSRDSTVAPRLCNAPHPSLGFPVRAADSTAADFASLRRHLRNPSASRIGVNLAAAASPSDGGRGPFQHACRALVRDGIAWPSLHCIALHALHDSCIPCVMHSPRCPTAYADKSCRRSQAHELHSRGAFRSANRRAPIAFTFPPVAICTFNRTRVLYVFELPLRARLSAVALPGPQAVVHSELRLNEPPDWATPFSCLCVMTCRTEVRVSENTFARSKRSVQHLLASGSTAAAAGS